MLQQRWEAKILRKESSPQPGTKLTTSRSGVLLAHHWAAWAGQRLEEGQMTESDTDPLTLPAHLKTKTIPFRPKRRLKHYRGLIIVIGLHFSHVHALCTVHTWIDGHGWYILSDHPSLAQRNRSILARSIDGCVNDGSIDSAARSIDRADRLIAHNIKIHFPARYWNFNRLS